MKIVTVDDSEGVVLRQKAEQVRVPFSQEIKNFLGAFQDLFSKLGNAAGLAAPQVGFSYQIIIFQVPNEARQFRNNVHEEIPITLFINPTYHPVLTDGVNEDWEACFSVPDKMGKVFRYNTILYKAIDLNGKIVEGIAKGYLARVIQHEVGHLNGELFLDRIDEGGYLGSFAEMQPIREKEIAALRSINL